ncbi:MAG: type II toxin-antitoxin system PemK/MazF family toxin [Oscillatoriales cyanobacterium]|uniref:mRNA interferase n=1 Tax=Microcoleus anatoxicus PTRS2 TaxID=2705321 RepID=A0ABU8YUW1_9CYAN|nr:MAG: type II toxin-antitoxin system PemK/MazF family toxin [Oscillatoriales cyanobacterium]TAD92959.1 MAG: type II toxin-antitoxin system PemK/MazF family toxin [Oscillatoriales cyanobacterium]TAD97079.1 MAG: type II toxin-antitoxin system PemK/MazF family toxin [Oscillatoriales cyanobacterium]TAF01680.1 MAG: type II toxin-antitoxin system PemK/MazF family toxin [Oscillatoriales cyanobacterium]TAF64300.1 MAG: type II toxin-antitoxin system PemK/MazF family toxin [Oscillatoriales cyanobacteri
MPIRRGEIWIANLDPTQGSEQAGVRPTIIFQNDTISRYTTTVISIPLTTNLRRASLPSCVLIPGGEGGLTQDSVALCHQLRVLDKTRLRNKIGEVNPEILAQLENIILFTLGYLP